jgi:hypothetical protein
MECLRCCLFFLPSFSTTPPPPNADSFKDDDDDDSKSYNHQQQSSDINLSDSDDLSLNTSTNEDSNSDPFRFQKGKLENREPCTELYLEQAKHQKYYLQHDMSFHNRVTLEIFKVRSLEILSLYLEAIKYAPKELKPSIVDEFKRTKERFIKFENRFIQEELEEEKKKKMNTDIVKMDNCKFSSSSNESENDDDDSDEI